MAVIIIDMRFVNSKTVQARPVSGQLVYSMHRAFHTTSKMDRQLKSVLFDDDVSSTANEGDGGANWFLDSTSGEMDSNFSSGQDLGPAPAPIHTFHSVGGTIADFSNEPPLLEG